MSKNLARTHMNAAFRFERKERAKARTLKLRKLRADKETRISMGYTSTLTLTLEMSK